MTATKETTQTPILGDLPTDELRLHGHRLIEWAAKYLEEIDRYPVVAQVAPGETAARLDPAPPTEGQPLDQILADFERVILPGVTHWNHPAFFAYFAISSSIPGILGELLTATLD